MYNPGAQSDVPPPIAMKKAYDYDVDNNLIYEGWCNPGGATSAATWSIKKNTYSGSNLTVAQWADGNSLFDNVWDDRASLSYS